MKQVATQDMKQSQPARLSIVVPCYNESAMLAISIPKLTSSLKEMINDNMITSNSFILFVDDGSKDNTWEQIAAATKKFPGLVHGIRLTLNAGHQNALLCGLHHVTQRCDAAISIDADLQHDIIKVIPRMISQFYAGKEIVFGVRKSRALDNWFKRLTAVFFYKLIKLMGVNLIENHADFRLMSRHALLNLQKFSEVNLFIRGLATMLHNNTGVVYCEESARAAGKTKYPLKMMLSLALNGFTSFSVAPLRFISAIGAIVFVCSIAMVCYALFGFMTGKAIPGWASIAISLYLLGGMIMLSIGILGEYIGKLFMEAKKRPRYLVDTVISDEESNEQAS